MDSGSLSLADLWGGLPWRAVGVPRGPWRAVGVPRQPSGQMEGASPAGGAGEEKDGSPQPCRSADDWA